MFYEDLDYKNRVLFLSGERDTLDSLLDVGKEYKAIQSILEEMESEGVRPDDPQRTIALDHKDKITLRLLSAARETFTTLTYPHGDELHTADLMMAFQNNECRGEEQIREALKDKQKFTEDVSSDTFRKKCEQRLFTQQVMLWSEVKSRAAINTAWQWHHPGALDSLKDAMVSKDQWRVNAKYMDKGPFPEPTTDVRIQELHRDDNIGEVTLKITPVHGDAVYCDVGSEATPGSARVEDLHAFKTSEMNVSFLCVDSSGQHETGAPVAWKNKLTLKNRVYGNDTEKSVELRSAPSGAVIRYTTDGSNPRTSGAVYDNPFTVLKGTKMVLVIAESNGSSSEQLKVKIPWDNGNGEIILNPGSPATWKHEHKHTTTKESFDLIECLKKYEGEILGPGITIAGDTWIELEVDEKMRLDVGKIESLIDAMREVCSEGQVNIEVRSLWFPTGQKLTDFAADGKTDISNNEVEQ